MEISTYNRQRLAFNHKHTRCQFCHQVHKFFTINCKPTLIPDQWQDDSLFADYLVEVPKAQTDVVDFSYQSDSVPTQTA